MDACLATKTNYLDTANYEPIDVWRNLSTVGSGHIRTVLEKLELPLFLGCGFDPGVTSIFTAYAAKHHFDEIHTLDIVDCNAGDHGKAFATKFQP